MQARVLQQRLKRTATGDCAFGKAGLIAVRDPCALGVAQHLFAGHLTLPNIGVAFSGCCDGRFPDVIKYDINLFKVTQGATIHV